MRVKVTQEHIDLGWRHHFAWCPIGRAILDMKGVHDVKVGMDRIRWITSADGPFSAETPPEAQQFINDFDNKEGVKPFEFDLKPKSMGFGATSTNRREAT